MLVFSRAVAALPPIVLITFWCGAELKHQLETMTPEVLAAHILMEVGACLFLWGRVGGGVSPWLPHTLPLTQERSPGGSVWLWSRYGHRGRYLRLETLHRPQLPAFVVRLPYPRPPSRSASSLHSTPPPWCDGVP
jgi:hypothetical protein